MLRQNHLLIKSNRLISRQFNSKYTHLNGKLSLSSKLYSTESQNANKDNKDSEGFTLRKNPMVPYLILLSLISSVLIKIMTKQQEFQVNSERYETRQAVLNSFYEKLERMQANLEKTGKLVDEETGEIIDAEKLDELVDSAIHYQKRDADKTLEEIIKAIEQAEDEWIETKPGDESKIKKSKPVPVSAAAAAAQEATASESKETTFTKPSGPVSPSKFL